MMFEAQLFDECSVLIVDDQSTSRAILAQVIKNINPNTHIIEKNNATLALEWAMHNEADLVFVDYVMPQMNGVEFVKLLKDLPSYASVPVMMITVKQDKETRYEALDAGFTDFISKPVDVHECTARTKNLMLLHQQHVELHNKSKLLETLVKAATSEIKNREAETIMRLARAGEYKDAGTGTHLRRMALYSRAIAEGIGLSDEEAEVIELAAPLHDIGKIGISDTILRKQGSLDHAEIETMKQHPVIGFEILQDSPSKYLQKGGEIALAHHEKYDGSGYPRGLKGENIPLSARIVALADVFDALTSERPYKEAWSIEQAYEYIANESGKHFDPHLVKVMQSIYPAIKKIHDAHKEATVH